MLEITRTRVSRPGQQARRNTSTSTSMIMSMPVAVGGPGPSSSAAGRFSLSIRTKSSPALSSYHTPAATSIYSIREESSSASESLPDQPIDFPGPSYKRHRTVQPKSPIALSPSSSFTTISRYVVFPCLFPYFCLFPPILPSACCMSSLLRTCFVAREARLYDAHV